MIHEVDPLTDPRWPAFLNKNPRASIFHTSGWLEAVRRTYGYKSVVLTTSGPDSDLTDGLVFCCVQSWLAGRRLVSLPFSDHCEPLIACPHDRVLLLAALEERAKSEGCRYVELRPTSALMEAGSDWQHGQSFYLHRLDLRPGANAVFRQFHRDCIQRRIRRAERAEIEVIEGRDPGILKTFYGLVLQTRRRHGLPPQSMAWFENLLACLGESVMIRCAYKGGQPIAGILTLQHGKSLYYKYGASLACFHRFGAMPYLFWHVIRDAINCGLEEFDMGRSDCNNSGLVTFKERWGAERTALVYLRSPADARQVYRNFGRYPLVQGACRHMPDRCLTTLGTLAYRHID